MTSNSVNSFRAAMLLCAAVLISTGCGREERTSAHGAVVDPSKVKVEEAPDVNLLQVDHPERFHLATVELQQVRDELRVTGSVAPDVSRSVPVVSLTGGRVIDIKARLGDEVTKGQALLTMTSPDVSAAFADYQKFQADEALARKQFERAELLFSKGALAQKEVQVAEDTEQKAKVDVATAAERIRILGADLNQPSPILKIVAPVSGTIVEQNITAGTGVKSLDNSPNLFVIADLSHIWILCDVYENDLAKVRIGDAAEVRLNSYPDKALRGKVSNIARVLDPATRSAKVRLELNNPGGLMRPNMFASVTFSSATAQRRPVLPASAILKLHDKNWVFRKEGNGRFRRQEVRMGASLPNGMLEVVSGISAGDLVIDNALQFSSAADAS